MLAARPHALHPPGMQGSKLRRGGGAALVQPPGHKPTPAGPSRGRQGPQGHVCTTLQPLHPCGPRASEETAAAAKAACAWSWHRGCGRIQILPRPQRGFEAGSDTRQLRSEPRRCSQGGGRGMWRLLGLNFLAHV